MTTATTLHEDKTQQLEQMQTLYIKTENGNWNKQTHFASRQNMATVTHKHIQKLVTNDRGRE